MSSTSPFSSFFPQATLFEEDDGSITISLTGLWTSNGNTTEEAISLFADQIRLALDLT